VCRTQKREKLIQYGKRVWNIESNDEEEIIDTAIQKTRDYFESLGIKTRLSAYGISKDKIPVIIEQLESHGLTALSETGKVNLEVSRKILEKAF